MAERSHLGRRDQRPGEDAERFRTRVLRSWGRKRIALASTPQVSRISPRLGASAAPASSNQSGAPLSGSANSPPPSHRAPHIGDLRHLRRRPATRLEPSPSIWPRSGEAFVAHQVDHGMSGRNANGLPAWVLKPPGPGASMMADLPVTASGTPAASDASS
jgi:hypothetical protein